MRVDESSGAGEARRRAAALAESLALDAQDAGRVALIVSELAKNLVKHSKDGEILVSPLDGAGGVEIVALDRGPGIEDTREALRDGYSSKGTTGTGLGAVSRVADEFDIFSAPGQGTVALARVLAAGAAPRSCSFGVVSVPLGGETVSGDGHAVVASGDRRRILVVDGIGHGPDAKEAADTAIGVFRAEPARPLRRWSR